MTPVSELVIEAPGLTPEQRDAVVAAFEKGIEAPDFRLLSIRRVRELSALSVEPPGAILSVYVCLDGEHRARRAWEAEVKTALRRALEAIPDDETRARAEEDGRRVLRALESGVPEMGQGVMFFVSQDLGLWRQFRLPVAPPTTVHAGTRAYLRPLVRTLDEGDRFVVGLLGQEQSRILVAQFGVVEEALVLRGKSLRDLGTDQLPLEERDDVRLHRMATEAKTLARVIQLAMEQFGARYALLTGGEPLRSAVLHHLPEDVRERVAGSVPVHVHASVSEVARALEPVRQKIEEHKETEAIRRLEEAGPGRAAWGMAAVLARLNERRVMALVVDDRLRAPGGICPNCGVLAAEGSGPCPACATALVPEEDLVDAALERALEQDARIEIVRTEAGRARLGRNAPVGALLRF